MTAVAYGIAFPAARGVLAPGRLPVLDRISATPTAAFAVWKLRAAHAGWCMRVRRSADNAEQDIGFSGVDLDTAGLLAFVGMSDGLLTRFYDQSGNGRDLSQAVAAQQPKIVSAGALLAGIGGKATPTAAAASQQHLTSQPNFDLAALFSAGGVHTAICLARPSVAGTLNTAGYAQPASIGSYNGYLYHSYGSTKLIADLANSAPVGELSLGAIGFPSTHISVSKSDGATFKVYLDGGAPASGAQAPFTALNNTWARMFWANNPASYFGGGVAAALYFNVEVSLADLNTIGGELAGYAGIAWTPAI